MTSSGKQEPNPMSALTNNKTKKGTKFWTRLLWSFGIIVLCVMLAIWITGYTYIYKTLIFTYPGIDDIDIFDSRLVADTTSQPLPPASDYNKKKISSELEEELKLRESVAFVVLKNDSIVYEQYWDNYTPNSLVNSFSVAKSIVGILTGIAIQKNLFSLDDPVGKFIPQFQDGDNRKLKVRHLLTMSSGLNWDESYSSLFSKTTEAYYGTNLEKLVTKLKVVEEPGKIFRYMSCNTVLLAMVISKTSGKNISEFASENLWKQIGANQPAYWSLDHHEGLEKSYCCFYSTATDFARIGKLYLDSGKWNNKQILSEEFVNEAVSPNGCIDETGNKIDYYGYHWWLTNYDGHRIFYARGILGQYIIVIPDQEIVIVRLGRIRGEKVVGNRYSDMVLYTSEVLKEYGTHFNNHN